MIAPPIEVHDLTVAYRKKPVLWGIDFSIPEGEICAIVGPNGAGKSTLLKAIMGLIPASGGYVRVFGAPVEQKRGAIAYVPQRGEVDWDFPVRAKDVVLMGRYGKLPLFLRPSAADHRIALDALERVGMAEFAERQIRQLSGGQQQRVFLARALAQEAAIYLMDEPFAGVDAATELAIVDLFHELKRQNKTVICVHHDLHTVPQYFSHVMLINFRLIAAGPTQEVFTQTNLAATYGGRFSILSDVADQAKNLPAEFLSPS